MIVLVAVACACGGGTHAPAVPRTPAPPGPPAAEPYALAVVYEGLEIWIGNDQNPELPEDDPTRRVGVLDRLIAGFAEADLPHTAPPEALATLISYGNKASIRMPMGPARDLTPERFGTQVDYYENSKVELVDAVRVATEELAKIDRPKKYLLVIGDGTDFKMSAAPQAVAVLRDRLAEDHVQVISIIYKSEDSLPGDALAPLQPGKVVPTGDALEHELAATLRRL